MESTEDGLDLNTILDKFYRLNQGDVTNEIISNLKSEIKKIYDEKTQIHTLTVIYKLSILSVEMN